MQARWLDSLCVRVLVFALGTGCGGGTSPGGTSPTAPPTDPTPAGPLFVVAPHPDDEVLMAGATLADAATRGLPHEVIVVTNGDLGCERDGWRREDETIAALAALGVTEEHVHFLGYPDGWLDTLGSGALPALARTARDGTCGTGTTTYGARGAERGDLHTALTGAPAPYTADALIGDLATLFSRTAPAEIHLPHGIDAHPDHAATYVLVRRALERADLPTIPRLVRHVVHAGPCWPATDGAGACVVPSPALAQSALPPLPAPLERLAPDVVRVLDAAFVERWRAAIGRYESQLEGPLESAWLASFARTTEAGWSQTLTRRARGDLLVATTGASGEVELPVVSPDAVLAAWRAPVVARASLVPGASFTLAAEAGDGYRLARSERDVLLVRGDRVLLRVSLPDEPAAAALSVRVGVARTPDGHVELEVRAGTVFIGSAVDPGGITRGTGLLLGPGATDATLVPAGMGFDEPDPLR